MFFLLQWFSFKTVERMFLLATVLLFGKEMQLI